jgi:hypothetical protein
MANYVNAEQFINRMEFISPESEEQLRAGEPLKFTLTCTAVRDQRNFAAFAGMLKSDVPEIASLIEDGELDLEELANSDIPSVLASNTLATDSSSLDSDIVVVTDEQHQQLEPGRKATVRVRLNEDDDGRSYLNAKVLEVEDYAEGSTESVGFEQVENRRAEAPSA